MYYDLNATPIVIKTSRWKMVLLLVVSLVFVVGGFGMLRDPNSTIVAYGVIAFFSLGIAVSIWRIFSPAYLELSPRGLSWFTGLKTEQYAWRDFTEFRACAPLPRSVSKHVGFILAPQSSKLTNVGRAVRNLVGVDGSFGGSWSVGTKELVDLLNSARIKWSAIS